jgi:hypothetical protein
MECLLEVAADGYEIIEGNGQPDVLGRTSLRTETGKFLVPRVRDGAKYVYLPSSPEYGGLAYNFADLQTEEGLVAFANRYGTLGQRYTYKVKWLGSRNTWGEPLRGWKHEIRAMNCSIRLWEATKAKDLESVQELALESLKYRLDERPVSRGRQMEFSRSPLSFHSGYPSVPYEILQRLGKNPPDDFGGAPSREYKQLQEKLKQVHPAFVQGMSTLGKLINHKLESALRRRLLWAPDGKGLELADVPVDLLGAMWTQLALSITENRQRTQCLNCDRWIEVSKSYRYGRHYCGDSCKMQAYRRRKKETAK